MTSRRIPLARAIDTVRKNLWPICVVILLSSNGLLIWRTRQMGAELNRVYQPISTTGLHALMMAPLSIPQGGTIMLERVPTHYLVLFIFARYDAPFYANEAVNLNRIVHERPDIAVLGLMAYATPDQALEFVRREGIAYPVAVDTDGRLLRGLNLPRTPWKIVLDYARRKLIYQDPPAMTEQERLQFLAKVLCLPKYRSGAGRRGMEQ
ncbi:MAG TPA: hypothetical protein VFZ08_13760 [Terriglobia bacterium]|nr:hypothetical protein [Terriglobia bacterium]